MALGIVFHDGELCFDDWIHLGEHPLPSAPSTLAQATLHISKKRYNDMLYSIAQLNQMNQAAFVAALGAVFEETPEIAREAWAQRPFMDLTDLHQAMVDVINAMTQAERLALIRAHPDLGSKAKMADASVQEQAGAGLDRLTTDEYDRFHALNQAYKEKFGFPFIIAVKHHTKASILEAFDRRLHHTPEAEVNQALTEIAQIAHLRLAALLTSA